jgi:hypothetical protein
MHRLYCVYFQRASGRPDFLSIDSVMSQFGDWIRVSPTQWFVWTDRQKALGEALSAARINPTDQFVMVAVQAEAAGGHAPSWIWDWLNDKMTRQFQGRP